MHLFAHLTSLSYLTELLLETNFSSNTNVKSQVVAYAYMETMNKAIGVQCIMCTTEPISSSSSADINTRR